MNSRGSFWANIPPVTKHLLIINFLLWLATIVMQRTAAFDLQDCITGVLATSMQCSW